MPRKSDAARKSDIAIHPPATHKADLDVEPRFSPNTTLATDAAPNASALRATQINPGSAEKKDKEPRDAKDSKDTVNIEELNLPKSIITRLAKGVLPPNIQIQSNAVIALRQSATVFINYLASHANEHVQAAGKKTVLPADVFQALDDVEFGFLRPALEAEFAKFNEIQSARRTNSRQKSAVAKQPSAAAPSPSPATEGDTADAGNAADRGVDGGSRAKKPKVDASAVVAGPGDEDAGDAETEAEDDVEDEDEEEEAEDEDEDEDEDDEQNEDIDMLDEREQRDDDDDDDEGDDSD